MARGVPADLRVQVVVGLPCRHVSDSRGRPTWGLSRREAAGGGLDAELRARRRGGTSCPLGRGARHWTAAPRPPGPHRGRGPRGSRRTPIPERPVVCTPGGTGGSRAPASARVGDVASAPSSRPSATLPTRRSTLSSDQLACVTLTPAASDEQPVPRGHRARRRARGRCRALMAAPIGERTRLEIASTPSPPLPWWPTWWRPSRAVLSMLARCRASPAVPRRARGGRRACTTSSPATSTATTSTPSPRWAAPSERW